MKVFFLCFFTTLAFLTSGLRAQQVYSGNDAIDCGNTDETGPNSALLYSCNGERHSCKAFLIFRSQFPYDSVPTISNLTSSDPRELAHINNISNSSPFPPDQEVIVPSMLLLFRFGLYQFEIESTAQMCLSHPEPNCEWHKVSYPLAVSPPLSPIPWNRKLRKGLCVGIGTGLSVIVLCFVLFVGFYCYKRKKLHGANGKEAKNKLQPSKDLLRRIASVDHALKVYEFREIQAATENFSHQRRLSESVHRGYMENGSLKDWLQRETCQELQSWNYRLQIALDVANGLHYLHNFTDPAYVHRDINSSNVLLSRDLRAKIANFSLARSAEQGQNGYSPARCALVMRGYVAPEYLEAGLVTPMMDVYAFGVVLLELITGKGAVFQKDVVELPLLEEVMSIMDGGNEDSEFQCLIDPRLQVKHPLGYIIDQSELGLRMMKLSVACLAQEPSSRVCMSKVVSTLRRIQLDASKFEY
ncbi:hypothetical protein Acr_05g0001960 [Actinidia rufa]|uniref:Protein kinase domain-containing protein n=1 Tax=Actinidia rufa TaxID=165716 RepID=A0A7J0ELX6_9ERIC|nr:hypothetical protein Acr_05g0001960 [Actinidia rufa]